MRFRMTLLAIAVLATSAIVSSVPALGQAPRSTRLADAAPTPHTLYVIGSTLDSAGHPSLLAGLASVNVDSSGGYSGTLTTAGPVTQTLQVTGTITSTGMTLTTTRGGMPLSVQAQPVVEPIGDRGKTSPTTTAGNEFRGTVMSGTSAIGSITVIDTGIMREYSFTAVVRRGPQRGTSINGSLFNLVDAFGDLRGYVLRDDNGIVYPVTGALGRGYLVIHVNLLQSGQIIGAATASRSVIAGLIVYRGSFGGPRNLDSGTWLSAPPE